MKENFTSINVILDRSGSMQGLAFDTMGGFNTFLSDQKKVPGEAVFTLCTFNTNYHLVHDFVQLHSVPDLNSETYKPSGGTALLDAVGTTINSVGNKLAAMPEEERPSKVIFLIMTDGQENSSKEFKEEQIKSMIEHQQTKYNWQFVYIGANVDSFTEAASLGINTNNAHNYVADVAGTHKLYSDVSESMTRYRSDVSSNEGFFNKESK